MTLPALTAPELLAPKDVSSLLGVSIGTLEVWRSTKRYALAYVKVGGRVRYRRRDIEQFLDARTEPGIRVAKTRPLNRKRKTCRG